MLGVWVAHISSPLGSYMAFVLILWVSVPDRYMKFSCYHRLEIVRAQFSPCAFVNLVFRYFVFVPAIVEDSIITSNRSDTQRFDVCKMFAN